MSNALRQKVFPGAWDEGLSGASGELLALAKEHLRHAGLLGKKTKISEPIDIPNCPELVGNTLDEHFARIGTHIAQPYEHLAQTLLAPKTELPPMPHHWVLQPGWTRYAPDAEPQAVAFPLENALVFDVEVLYKVSQYPVMAVAASTNAWYAWVSPVLCDTRPRDFEHLIPLDTHGSAKLVVGYNVSYDRARVMEEYHVLQSKAFFLDAMALHIAVSGFCLQQRPLWYAHRKHKSAAESTPDEPDYDEDDALLFSAHDIAQELMDDPWLNQGSSNSLASAAEFHCGIVVDKSARDAFSGTDVHAVVADFQALMSYCASDVKVTHQVARKLYPEFRAKNPHPVSFAALKLLGTLFCPTTTGWQQYIETAESVYQQNRARVTTILRQRAQELVEPISGASAAHTSLRAATDPWLMHLNWTIKQPRMRKDGTPCLNQAYLTGYPEWYRELFKTVRGEDGTTRRELSLTVRTRVTPYLLRLKWEGYPLVWTKADGWCFKVPAGDPAVDALGDKYTRVVMDPETHADVYAALREDTHAYELFRVPHLDDAKRRCTIIMSKSSLKHFDSGVLTSEYTSAREILALNASASYWMGNRARIRDQFVVYADASGRRNCFFDSGSERHANRDVGMIIPKFCAMGTVTRRATENTWLTAANTSSSRIGSELKAMVRPPRGYAFVGADVDSQELWIASLIGDSMFGLHGATALGWMTLEGDKNEQTDLHSRTAAIMGISRGDAKVFNYGRIYGAGVRFAAQLLQKFGGNGGEGKESVHDTEEAMAAKAQQLYAQTKGILTFSRSLGARLYHGGTELVMFNALEAIAQHEQPRTPVLGAAITDALTRRHLNKNSYLTSRVNWAIQSSGVDYLHLVVVAMEHLLQRYRVDARLMLTVHDEVRYMVRDSQRLECAVLLQIANLWTRAMFCEQLGIHDVPQSCAFFSEVDVDHVLRKDVRAPCVTPLHGDAISPGKLYTMCDLLAAFDVGAFLARPALPDAATSPYVPRVPVMEALYSEKNPSLKTARLRLENSRDAKEWARNMSAYSKEHKRATAGSNTMPRCPKEDALKTTSKSKREPRKIQAAANPFREWRDNDSQFITARKQGAERTEKRAEQGIPVREHLKHPGRPSLRDEPLLSEDGDDRLLQELARYKSFGVPVRPVRGPFARNYSAAAKTAPRVHLPDPSDRNFRRRRNA